MLASEFEAVRRFYALWTAQKQLLVLAGHRGPEQGVRRPRPGALRGRPRHQGRCAGRGGEPRQRPDHRREAAGGRLPGADRSRLLARVGPRARTSTRWTRRCPRPRRRRRVNLEQGLELARTNRPVLVQWDCPGEGGRGQRDLAGRGLGAAAAASSCSGSARAPRPTPSTQIFGKQSAVTGGHHPQLGPLQRLPDRRADQAGRAQVAQAKLNLAQNERDVEGQVKVALDSSGRSSGRWSSRSRTASPRPRTSTTRRSASRPAPRRPSTCATRS